MAATEYLERMRGTSLEPEIQAGDALAVRGQDHAEEGQLAVVLGAGDVAEVRRYSPGDGPVVGVVTFVYRRLA